MGLGQHGLGRLIRLEAPDPAGSGPLDVAVNLWTYDRAGDLIAAIDPAGNVTRT